MTHQHTTLQALVRSLRGFLRSPIAEELPAAFVAGIKAGNRE